MHQYGQTANQRLKNIKSSTFTVSHICEQIPPTNEKTIVNAMKRGRYLLKRVKNNNNKQGDDDQE